jgi:hypothetical protein
MKSALLALSISAAACGCQPDSDWAARERLREAVCYNMIRCTEFSESGVCEPLGGGAAKGWFDSERALACEAELDGWDCSDPEPICYYDVYYAPDTGAR